MTVEVTSQPANVEVTDQVVTVEVTAPVIPQVVELIDVRGVVHWEGILGKPEDFPAEAHGNERHTVEFIAEGDPRLEDARTPVDHQGSHLAGGSDAIFPIHHLDVQTEAEAPAYALGRVFWDSTNQTWALMTSTATVLQIGQETVIRCHNQGATPILNGTPVKIIGGNHAPIVTMAMASLMDAEDTLGIATQDIPADGYGFVTAFGMVNDVNTAGMSGTLYLAANGGLTDVKPVYPNAVIHIGHVVEVHETTGRIFVDVKPETFQKFFDVFNLGGVFDKAESTIAYNAGTRTLSIAPVGEYWSYFKNGKEFRETVLQSVVHPATTGLHFFYINSSLQFVTTTTPWDLLEDTPIMAAYYNAVTGEGYAFEERHGVRDPEWHRGQHNTVGTYYVSGLAASGYLLNSAVDANVQFGVDAGIVRDEDLSDPIAGQVDGGTYNVLWRSGADGSWRITASVMPYTYGTYPQYNQWTGATWQLTDLTNGDYVNMYVVALPCIDATKTIVCVPGQSKYTSLSAAQNASVFNDVSWGALPFVEFSIIHKFTMRAGSSYTNTGKARIEAYADLRGTTKSVQITAGAGSTHNGLAGLNVGDYIHLTAAEYATLIPEAPMDGKIYGRQNGTWVEIV